MGGGVSDKRDKASTDRFTDIVLSWSLEDICNENLYLNQVLGFFCRLIFSFLLVWLFWIDAI